MSLVFGLGECPVCAAELAGLVHGCDECGWTADAESDR